MEFSADAKTPLWKPAVALVREHRGLIHSMVRREVTSRYKGSLFGAWWAFIQPAAMGDNPRGCYGNALRCAVELSVLDAFGQVFGEPVSTLTRHFEPAAQVCGTNPTVRYSALCL